MKKVFLFSTVLLSIQFLFAQKKIEGQILSKSDQAPIYGVNVVLKGNLTGTYTDESGKFSLEISEKIEQPVLFISHIGHKKKEVAITSFDKPIKIEIEKREVLADEVIVSATRAGRNTATTYSEVSKEEIETKNLGQDLPFILEQEPSLVATSDAGAGVGYTGLRIRGSDQSRINVTINGIPYNDPESQGVFWVNLPDFASSVDNIQIQRGLGTSTNGAGAFGGTINIQTTKLNQERYGEFSTSYGSFNTWKTTVNFGTGLIKDHFTIDGRFSKVQSDGFIDRATSDLKGLFLSAGYYNDRTLLRINAFTGVEETYQSWYGTYEPILDTNRTYNYYNYENEVDHYQQDHYQAILSQEAGRDWMINAALHYTRGRGYFEQYKGEEYNNDDGFNSPQSFADYGLENIIIGSDTITETALVRRRWLDNHFFGMTFSADYEKKKLRFGIGGAANRYLGKHYGEVIWAEHAINGIPGHRYYDNDGIKNDFNIYIKATYNFGKISLFADLQYRYVGYSVNGVDNDQRYLSTEDELHFFNPKLGFTWFIKDQHEVYASIAIGSREPTRNDYIDAPGGKTPKPETLRDLEIGYKFKKPKNVFGVTGYFMHYKDQLVLTGELNDVGSPIRKNVDKSYRTGIEIYNQLNIADKVTFNANFTYSMNKINRFEEVLYVYDFDYNYLGDQRKVYENTDISYSPSIIAGGELTYNPISTLKLTYSVKGVGKQYLDNTRSEERKLDPYVVSNFRVSYQLHGDLVKEVLLTVQLYNITNTEYQANGYVFSEIYSNAGEASRSDYNYYYPQAGIHAMGGVTIKF